MDKAKKTYEHEKQHKPTSLHVNKPFALGSKSQKHKYQTCINEKQWVEHCQKVVINYHIQTSDGNTILRTDDNKFVVMNQKTVVQ